MLTPHQRTCLLGLLNVAIGAVVLVALLFVLTACGKSQPVPTRPVYVSETTLTGTSMLPMFTNGERVLLDHASFDDIAPGWPVVFWSEPLAQFVCHIADHRDKTGLWVTRGLNNSGNDRGHMRRDLFVGRARKKPEGIIVVTP